MRFTGKEFVIKSDPLSGRGFDSKISFGLILLFSAASGGVAVFFLLVV